MTKYLGPKTDPANVSTQGDKPDLATTAPSQITVTTAAQGSGTTAARADHVHSISTGTPASLTAVTTNATGNATSLARSNHTHSISTAAAATQTGLLNLEGTSTSLARADHTHAISPPRGKGSRSSSQTFTNSTTAAVELTTADIQEGFTTVTNLNTSNARITVPVAGDYLIVGECQWAGNTSGRRELGYDINGGADQIVTSLHVTLSNATRQNFSVLVTLAASDFIRLRAFQNSGGNLVLNSGSISVVRVG